MLLPMIGTQKRQKLKVCEVFSSNQYIYIALILGAAHSSTSNYDRLIKLLQPLAHKWHKLAKSLNFLPGDVSKLASKGGDDAAKMERIIRTWWEQNKEVDRMRMLIKCLEKSNLGESDLRDKLQKGMLML